MPRLVPSSSASNESCLHFVAIAGLANRPKTSEFIWLYPVFAFICYVSIHLEISATVVRSAPEELPIRIRTTSFRGCGIGQGSGCPVQMRLMKLDLLFVAKRLAFLSDENRLTWFCRDKE